MTLFRLGEVEAKYFFKGSWLSQLPLTFEEQNVTALTLFHGYGANASDLASIAEYYHQRHSSSLEKNILWIFPQGPINLSAGFSEFAQRAWFPISVERLMMQKIGGPDFLSQQEIEDAERLFKNIETYFGLLSTRGIKKIILGGFSQGGMVAYHLLPRVVKFFSIELLALFSTVSIDFKRYDPLWKNSVNYQSLKKILQSHGFRDEILPYQEGKNLHAYLAPYFQDAKFLEINDGHTIPENVLLTFFHLI